MQIKPLQENVLSNKERRSLVGREEAADFVANIALIIAAVGMITTIVALSQIDHRGALPGAIVGFSLFISSSLVAIFAATVRGAIGSTLEMNPQQKIVPDAYEMGEAV